MYSERGITGLCAWQNNKLEVSNITGWQRNMHAGCVQVHNWVKWPERVSDHKTLSYIELTDGALIMCLHECMEHLNGRSAQLWCVSTLRS
jgi:hypothetical protein